MVIGPRGRGDVDSGRVTHRIQFNAILPYYNNNYLTAETVTKEEITCSIQKQEKMQDEGVGYNDERGDECDD